MQSPEPMGMASMRIGLPELEEIRAALKVWATYNTRIEQHGGNIFAGVNLTEQNLIQLCQQTW